MWKIAFILFRRESSFLHGYFGSLKPTFFTIFFLTRLPFFYFCRKQSGVGYQLNVYPMYAEFSDFFYLFRFVLLLSFGLDTRWAVV